MNKKLKIGIFLSIFVLFITQPMVSAELGYAKGDTYEYIFTVEEMEGGEDVGDYPESIDATIILTVGEIDESSSAVSVDYELELKGTIIDDGEEDELDETIDRTSNWDPSEDMCADLDDADDEDRIMVLLMTWFEFAYFIVQNECSLEIDDELDSTKIVGEVKWDGDGVLKSLELEYDESLLIQIKREGIPSFPIEIISLISLASIAILMKKSYK
jgi:hypothetical protein